MNFRLYKYVALTAGVLLGALFLSTSPQSVSAAGGICTGISPTYASYCPTSLEAIPLSNTPKVLVDTCTSAKCEFLCDPGYVKNGTVCEPICGDNNTVPGEFCDDGDATDDGTCNSDCTANTYCGDWTKQTPNGNSQTEQCDDGNTIDGDGCNSDCTTPVCTGTPPGNATICTGDNTPPADTSKVLVASCSSSQSPYCEYSCDTNYVLSGGVCVIATPSCSLISSDYSVTPGTAVSLSWSGSNLVDCDVNSWNPVDTGTTGSVNVTVNDTTTYELTCNGATQSTTCEATVSVSYSCTGFQDPNSILCSGDSTGLSSDTPYVATSDGTISTCSSSKCEFYCEPGFTWDGTQCSQDFSPPSFENIGDVCIDTEMPAAPSAGDAIEITTEVSNGNDYFINKNPLSTKNSAQVDIRFAEETISCGDTFVRLRLSGSDGSYEYTTNGINPGVEVVKDGAGVIDPTPDLASNGQLSPVTSGGITTIGINLIGVGGTGTIHYDTVEVDIIDGAGNTRTFDIGQTFTVDGTPPTCNITNPASPQTVMGNFPITIEGDADDEANGSGLADYTIAPQAVMQANYEDDGSNVGSESITWDTDLGPNGPGSFSFDSTSTIFNEVILDIPDAVGNNCQVNMPFLVDITPPELVRALPVSRGFISPETRKITLEFYEEDVAAVDNGGTSWNDNISTCNDRSVANQPPNLDDRITLYDITDGLTSVAPMVTELLSPDCGGSIPPTPPGTGSMFPTTPVRSNGVDVPTFGTNGINTEGHYFYTFLEIKDNGDNVLDDYNGDGIIDELQRGHTYEIRVRNIEDMYGNIMPGVNTVYFTYYDYSQPLRIRKDVTGALGTTYSDADLQAGKSVEISKPPARADDTLITAKTNCFKEFGDPIGQLDSSPYVVKNTLTLVTESSETLASPVLTPYSVSDVLPPYFNVVDTNPACAIGAGRPNTEVEYRIIGRDGTVKVTDKIDLIPSIDDLNTGGDFRHYGRNIDLPETNTSYHKGEKGRKIAVEFDDVSQELQPGDMLEVIYYTYVTGYTDADQ